MAFAGVQFSILASDASAAALPQPPSVSRSKR